MSPILGNPPHLPPVISHKSGLLFPSSLRRLLLKQARSCTVSDHGKCVTAQVRVFTSLEDWRHPSLIEKCIPKVSNKNLVGTQKIKQYDARRGLFKINTRLWVVPDRMFAIHPVKLLFNRKEPFPVVCTLFVLKRQDRACPLPKAMRTYTLTILKSCSIIITECWCEIAGAICCLVSHSQARNNTQKHLSHPFPFVSVFPSLLWLHERSGLPLESGLSVWTVQAVRGPNQWPLVTVG